MINKIKKYIKANSKIYFLLRNLNNINNHKFVNRANKIMDDSFFCDSIERLSYGNKNFDKNILLINLNYVIGMGGFLRWTLYGIIKAKMLGFIPVVEYGSKCPYKEKDNILNTNNVFEYYFNQPTSISLEETYKSNRVFITEIGMINIEKEFNIYQKLPGGYEIDENFIIYLGKVYKETIKLNKVTETFIEKSIEKTFPVDWKNKKILAIHVRGTDYATGLKNHPQILEVRDFFKEIDTILEKNNFDYIFLATDDKNRLKAFKNKYGNKLIYFKDVHRSSEKTFIAHEKNDRKNNNYLNGLEVIRDMYTLACCQGLICGISHVSITARIIKYSYNKKYDYMKILDKGFYR